MVKLQCSKVKVSKENNGSEEQATCYESFTLKASPSPEQVFGDNGKKLFLTGRNIQWNNAQY